MRKTAAPSPQLTWGAIVDYLRAFASLRHGWLVLGRNLIPVAGVYLFGWSIGLTTFNYWFDGVSGLAAILAVLSARAVVETGKEKNTGVVKLVLSGVVVWVLLFGLCGIPYWFLLDMISRVLQSQEIADQLRESPMLWVTFGLIVVGNFGRALRSGYMTMPEGEMTPRVQADFFSLIARAIAMTTIANWGLGFLFVPLMAIALTIIEVWPELQAAMLEKSRARQSA